MLSSLLGFTASCVLALAVPIDDTPSIQLAPVSKVLEKRDDLWRPTKNRYHLYQSFPKLTTCPYGNTYTNAQLYDFVFEGFPISGKGQYGSLFILFFQL